MFIYNHKRTYRAVMILLIGTLAVITTNMLIQSFIIEVEDFSTLIERSSLIYEIYNKNNPIDPISDETIIALENIFAESINIDYYKTTFNYPGELKSHNISLGWYEFSIVNISKAIILGDVIIIGNQSNNFSYINNEINIRSKQNLSINIQNSKINIINGSRFISQFYDVIIDRNSPIIPSNLKNKWNLIELKFFDRTNIDEIVKSIDKLENIEITLKRSDLHFLVQSSNQLSHLLQSMQLGFSIILIISIANVMIALVNDSKTEIRLLRIIGMTKNQVRLIFLGQAFLIGLISFVLSLLLSIIILTIVLSTLASTTIFPYITVDFDMEKYLLSFYQSMTISIFAGLISLIRVFK